ncbi:putative amidoligase enzyme-domain-containing protein [Rhexocercosporidium sp. MPI-PUGE-AT-0058]|nr:putative amidoligase enzyme-domain-containing protein [Rhexocercosporidium sp. MPI-PUGE-AT-0058]
MSRPFTFGVELEMMVALVREGQQNPNPTEHCIVKFPATNDIEDISKSDSKARNAFPAIFYANRVRAEFKRIIREAGFPLALTGADTCGWAVVGDTSLRHPPDDAYIDTEGYDWCGIEVKTPALPFTPESLQAVKDMCALIPKNFKILTNSSTGLHVHIGHGESSFSTHVVAKIMAFIYTFEPQISSLHPIHRYSHPYGKAMRHTCHFSAEFQRVYGEMPPTLMAITKILTTTRRKESAHREELAYLVRTRASGKNGNYNFSGMADLNLDVDRPTIEFRQHEGTMDGELIIQWVQLLVGMLAYIENEEYASFLNFLITTAEKEKWQKLGDGKDAEREASMGLKLADGAFNIIDMLRYIGLSEQANYFKDKVYKHDIPLQALTPQTKGSCGIEWEYQNRLGGVARKTAEYRRDDERRRLFEKFRIAKLAAKMAGDEWTFNEDRPVWPLHWADPEFVDESEESDASNES